eukprot:gnl/TRDRNA2_/TRDRNA2_117295_c2_seq1.p1 gnl/TRDRNA2_/TRDRNA2_117295_c2~~gnl/TRDRNA2_/TRDRNA2_117295_c2_seq1.p1  ORF type:complete len:453 (-),score=85.23 gnl/TRDRNA2_/TRDRNA2_117295_c2_seq1:72-1430(-)
MARYPPTETGSQDSGAASGVPAPAETAPDVAEKLKAIRARMDTLGTQLALSTQGQGPPPDPQELKAGIRDAEELLKGNRLSTTDRVHASFMIGCGYSMIGDEENAVKLLMRVAEAPVGSLAPGDHLSGLMLLAPILRKTASWEALVQVLDKAKAVASDRWVDKSLPYIKGLALTGMRKHAEAAACYEEAINMDPGFKNAFTEFDAAVTQLGDFERCRKVAQKLVDHGGHWVNCWQRPIHLLRDPLPSSKPWYEAREFEFCRKLEESYEVIRQEVEQLLAERFEWGRVGSQEGRGNDTSTHDSDLIKSGDWREIVLLGDTTKSKANSERCPETSRILRSFPEIAEAASTKLGESLFSQLTPGTHLRPHCGPTNMRLTCHLGIRIPEGCSITCGGEKRTWEEGKCLVFDDSYEHEVTHEGTEPRIVLLVNFWHPDLAQETWPSLIAAISGEPQA